MACEKIKITEQHKRRFKNEKLVSRNNRESEREKRNGYRLTEEELESYYYAKNVIESEETEIAYLNEEENY